MKSLSDFLHIQKLIQLHAVLSDVVDLCGCGNNSVTENGMGMEWETGVEKPECTPL